MIKNHISIILVSMAILSCAVVLPDKILSRNLYYLFCLFVLIYSIYQYKSIELRKKDIFLASGLLIVGLSQLLWKYRFPSIGEDALMADLGYGRSGFYLVLGAFFLPFFFSMLRKFPLVSFRTAHLMVFIGFLYLSGRGIYYFYFFTEPRLRIENSATLTAYIFLLYSMMTLYLLLMSSGRYRWVMSGIVVLISLWLVFLTETRSILLLYPFLLFSILLQTRLFSMKKTIFIGFISAMVIIIMAYLVFPSAQLRLVGIITEIQSFQHDHGNSSIGARLSMWQAGVMAIVEYPWGLGSHERLELITQLMIQNGNNGSEALRNIVYHLHNDFIESMSLQGVTGGIALLYFFASLFNFFFEGSKKNSAILFFPLPILLICMVDTLFIQDRFIIMLVMGIAVYAALIKIEPRRNIL